MPLCWSVCHLSVWVCSCVFQVRRMVAASPRVSGFTSVIQPFRWSQSHGYLTLRRTCFFMKNCCKDKRTHFSVDLFYFVFLRYCICLHYLSFYIGKMGKKMEASLQHRVSDKTSSSLLLCENSISFIAVLIVSLLILVFRSLLLKSL